jgi:exodeoxyribonuclease V gamma subunit
LRPAQDPVDAPWQSDDRSVVFQVAHSPVRELEVLHDQLLQWFHQMPEVSPRDVVVMVPDIEVMAPAIRAVFGQYKRSDARFIPFDIADLGAQASSPLIHAVEWLLALPQQRGRMSELVALLEVPALAARFGIQPAQVPSLTRWMAGSGIRWGLSAAHRQGLGLASCGEDNSALFGVQRMLMGYACGADPMPSGAVGADPYAEVGGLDAELAGALAHLLQALIDWWQVSNAPASALQWAERARAMLAALFKPQDDSDRNALAALDQALNDWLQAVEQAQFAEVVPLAVARSAWLEALKVPKLEQRFRAGGVTFCTLMPMRAIPFQMACLLGMNDGDYPRRSPRADFDLLGWPGMARPGDRSRRDDDRQLMLEALLSARRVLYVSWSGRSVRDNSEQPPSVLVSQLRDEIDALWGAGTSQELTTVHPLQPFSRSYFEVGSPLQTYAKEWRLAQDIQRADAAASGATSALRTGVVLPPLQSATGTPVVTLAQLARFLRRPVGAFFRERLQVHLDDERSELHDEELFGLAGLDLYPLLDHALTHVPAQLSRQTLPAHVQQVVQNLRKAGALPLAGVGALAADQLARSLQAQLDAALRERENFPDLAERLLIDVSQTDVHLQDALGGVLVGEGGALALHLRASSLANLQNKQPQALPEKLIDVWLISLAAAAMDHALPMVVVGRNAVVRVPPQDAEPARAQLQALLETWVLGMRWPLPLPPETALQWLRAPDKDNALLDVYEGGQFKRAERSKDPALARTYPTLEDLRATPDFEHLAQKVYAPLLAWAQACVVEPLAMGPEDGADQGFDQEAHA